MIIIVRLKAILTKIEVFRAAAKRLIPEPAANKNAPKVVQGI